MDEPKTDKEKLRWSKAAMFALDFNRFQNLRAWTREKLDEWREERDWLLVDLMDEEVGE